MITPNLAPNQPKESEAYSPSVELEYADKIIAIELQPSTLAECGLAELENLPRDIAIMGGAARAVLQRQLFGEDAIVRDIDLIQIDDIAETSGSELCKLSEQFMPDDNQHGHGIDSDYLDDYFESRDFTINEVLVVDGKIIASPSCIKDLRDKVVRPTDWEADIYETYDGTEFIATGPKLSFKAMVMKAVFEAKYGQSSYAEDYDPKGYSSDGFFFALAMNKAAQYDDQIPGVLDKFMSQNDFSPWESNVEIASELSDYLHFDFRGSQLAKEVNYRKYGAGAIDNIPSHHEADQRYDTYDWVERISINGLQNRARQLAIREFDTFC